MNRHDYWSPTVDLKEQRERETHGDDPKAFSRLDECLAESRAEVAAEDDLSYASGAYSDPAYRYMHENKIDHVLPNGTKVSYVRGEKL